jgi:hypothetical protein
MRKSPIGLPGVLAPAVRFFTVRLETIIEKRGDPIASSANVSGRGQGAAAVS